MNPKFSRTLASLLLVSGLFLVLAQPAHAQSSNELFTNLRLNLFIPFRGDDLFTALMGILNFALLVGGIVAFFFVLFGGFVYLTAGGDAAKAGQGRTIIVNAIIGIIIIFLSLALVRFVVSRTKQSNLDTNVSFLTR